MKGTMNSQRALFVLGLCLTAVTMVSAVEVDGVVATVGNHVILRSEVIDVMKNRGVGISQYSDVLNQQIERRLILNDAAESKVTIQDWVVENRLREIIERNYGGDRNRLLQALNVSRMNFADFRQRIREDLIEGAMRWKMVQSAASASPAEMKAEFTAHPEKYRIEGKTTVSVIVLAPSRVVLKDEVTEMLKTNTFSDVAIKYSDGPKRLQGGVWKDVLPSESFKPEIAEVINQLPVGTMSDWITLDGWSFLILKNSEIAGKAMTFAEAYDQIKLNVLQDEMKKLHDAWIARLKAKTYIKVEREQ